MVRAFPATADNTGQITLNFTGAVDAALVNGIEVLTGATGATVVQAINCGQLAGGTLTVNPVTWSNSGTLGVVNGSSLNLSGSWSTSTPLSVNAGTINANGTWTNSSNLTVTVSGTGVVNMQGTVVNNIGGVLNLAGGGAINLQGTIQGGAVTSADGTRLCGQWGTLDFVTVQADIDLAKYNGSCLYIVNGLILSNATVYVGNAAGSTYGRLSFNNTQTLGGTGTILFGKNGANALYTQGNVMLTIGAGITVRGSIGTVGNWYGNGVIVNQGTISADDSGGASSFAYDSGFSGGGTGNTSDAIDTSGVSNPAPAVVYQTWRAGSAFSYALTNLTAGASYTVRLHFAEPSYNNAWQRQFNVRINNAPVLTNFDIVAAAGGRDKAVVRAFPATADHTGQITLNFTGAVDAALVNGIEVLTGATVVQAINCGQLAGGTLTVNPVTWSNSGTLAVVNGSSLNLSGSWSTSTPLSVNAGTINAGGTWTNSSNLTVTVSGTGVVNMQGTVVNNIGGALNLAGGGAINLQGTIQGGTVTSADGTRLCGQGGTLDYVTVQTDIDLAKYNGSCLYIVNGLILSNATVYVGNAAGFDVWPTFLQQHGDPGRHRHDTVRQERCQWVVYPG